MVLKNIAMVKNLAEIPLQILQCIYYFGIELNPFLW